uniref:Uncharacterized protein n=1 Tax=Arundo donax TaxID=35708 RepID=A0A0A9P5E9_ARUDO
MATSCCTTMHSTWPGSCTTCRSTAGARSCGSRRTPRTHLRRLARRRRRSSSRGRGRRLHRRSTRTRPPPRRPTPRTARRWRRRSSWCTASPRRSSRSRPRTSRSRSPRQIRLRRRGGSSAPPWGRTGRSPATPRCSGGPGSSLPRRGYFRRSATWVPRPRTWTGASPTRACSTRIRWRPAITTWTAGTVRPPAPSSSGRRRGSSP